MSETDISEERSAGPGATTAKTETSAVVTVTTLQVLLYIVATLLNSCARPAHHHRPGRGDQHGVHLLCQRVSERGDLPHHHQWVPVPLQAAVRRQALPTGGHRRHSG